MRREAVLNFIGEEMDPLGALRRPYLARPVRRNTRTAMPAAWGLLLHTHWGVDKALAWISWQALTSSRYSECQALSQEVLLWQETLRHPRELTGKGITPHRLLKCVELLMVQGTLYPREVTRLETIILRYITAEGTWL